MRTGTRHRARVTAMFLAVFLATSALCGRLAYLMIFRSEYYSGKAEDLHQRERTIKAARGRIIDRNGTVIADNRTVCTVSVIHNQVEEPEAGDRGSGGDPGPAGGEGAGAGGEEKLPEIVKTNVPKGRGTPSAAWAGGGEGR